MEYSENSGLLRPESKFFDDDDIANRQFETKLEADMAGQPDEYKRWVDRLFADVDADCASVESTKNSADQGFTPTLADAGTPDAARVPDDVVGGATSNAQPGTAIARGGGDKQATHVHVEALSEADLDSIGRLIDYEEMRQDAYDPSRRLRAMMRQKLEEIAADKRAADLEIEQAAVRHRRQKAKLRKRKQRAKEPKPAKRPPSLLAGIIPGHSYGMERELFRSLESWVLSERGARAGQLRAQYFSDGGRRLRELVRFAEHYAFFVDKNNRPPSDKGIARKLRWKRRKAQSTRELVTVFCRPGGPWCKGAGA